MSLFDPPIRVEVIDQPFKPTGGFNVSFLNPKMRPKLKTDPETGCSSAGIGYEAYEACRQSYYIREQTNLLKSQQNVKKVQTSSTDGKQTTALELQNQKLKELLQKQNQEIQEFKNSLRVSSRLNDVFLLSVLVLMVIVAIKVVIKLKQNKI